MSKNILSIKIDIDIEDDYIDKVKEAMIGKDTINSNNDYTFVFDKVIKMIESNYTINYNNDNIDDFIGERSQILTNNVSNVAKSLNRFPQIPKLIGILAVNLINKYKNKNIEGIHYVPPSDIGRNECIDIKGCSKEFKTRYFIV